MSIWNKILKFKENIYFYKPKIIGICESWLNEGVPEGYYQIEEYKCFKQNRGRGRGVMLYVGNELESY